MQVSVIKAVMFVLWNVEWVVTSVSLVKMIIEAKSDFSHTGLSFHNRRTFLLCIQKIQRCLHIEQ